MGDSLQSRSRGAASIILYAVIGYVASFVLMIVAGSYLPRQLFEILRYLYFPLEWLIALFFGRC